MDRRVAEVAGGLVDGMKGLYAKLFDYLVAQVNGLFASNAARAAAAAARAPTTATAAAAGELRRCARHLCSRSR